ncbi:MAG: hypothetical protein ABJB74_07680 [Gemmatimonas sp.]
MTPALVHAQPACGAASMAAYTASGFACTLGSTMFSNFSFSTGITATTGAPEFVTPFIDYDNNRLGFTLNGTPYNNSYSTTAGAFEFDASGFMRGAGVSAAGYFRYLGPVGGAGAEVYYSISTYCVVLPCPTPNAGNHLLEQVGIGLGNGSPDYDTGPWSGFSRAARIGIGYSLYTQNVSYASVTDVSGYIVPDYILSPPTTTVTPEPASLAFVAIGLTGVLTAHRRKKYSTK